MGRDEETLAEISDRKQRLLAAADRLQQAMIKEMFHDLHLPSFSDLQFWNHPSMRPESAEERKFRLHRERIEQTGQLRLPFCKEVRL